MPRQSISIPKPNDERLKVQIDKAEYSTKSEWINDWIRAKLERSEANGFTSDAKEQILKQSKSMLNS